MYFYKPLCRNINLDSPLNIWSLHIYPDCYKRKFTFFSPSIRMINLSLNELKLIAKSRNLKDYKNKSENDLIKILSEPKPKINLSKKKIKEIKKDFNELKYGFSKSKINEFRRSVYKIKNQKIFPHKK